MELPNIDQQVFVDTWKIQEAKIFREFQYKELQELKNGPSLSFNSQPDVEVVDDMLRWALSYDAGTTNNEVLLPFFYLAEDIDTDIRGWI